MAISRTRALTASGRARELREVGRLSQSDIALACETTVAAVSRWEHGGRVPRSKALVYWRILSELQSGTVEVDDP